MRKVWIFAAFLLLIMLNTLAMYHPAQAHVFLKSSLPAAEQVVIQSPDQVVLTFNGEVAPQSTIQVTDASGQRVDTGDTLIHTDDKTVMSISVKPLSAGV